MPPLPVTPAAINQTSSEEIVLSGFWTARGIGAVARQLDTLSAPTKSQRIVNGARIDALDTAGAWILEKLLRHLRSNGGVVEVRDLRPEFAKLCAVITQQATDQADKPAPPARISPSVIEDFGRSAAEAFAQSVALLSFVGETAVAFAVCIARPARFRWRPILFNIRRAGFDALPIVGLLSFLLGIVVAYQGADQLRQYGANIFVADLVGLSILREFAPLITAIIIAGRSGSAYAAQIGTMAVTEEIDAMRTLGIPPLDPYRRQPCCCVTRRR